MDRLTKGKEARALFESGCNCAQAVAGAFSREMGLPRDTVLLLASPFGGGMGRMREVCGAISGTFLVLGALDGYLPTENKMHQQEKKRVYETVQTLAKQFEEENGSIICAQLLKGVEQDCSPTPSERTAKYYKKRPCADYVEFAADLIEKHLKNRGCEKE